LYPFVGYECIHEHQQAFGKIERVLRLNKLIAYAADFASFLLEHRGIMQIRMIVLFGSAARNEADKESDIDIFIDTVKDDKKLAADISKTLDNFYSSSKYGNYWKLKGVENTISLKVGRLDRWKDLKNSIISNGITLYGKFQDMPQGAEHKAIFSWGRIMPESRRTLLSKRLFGRREKDKFYEGLLQKYSGRKISPGTVIVSNEHAPIFVRLFRDMKIKVEVRKIVEYS
jgi:predicted nucleotidyltransferase